MRAAHTLVSPPVNEEDPAYWSEWATRTAVASVLWSEEATDPPRLRVRLLAAPRISPNSGSVRFRLAQSAFLGGCAQSLLAACSHERS